MEYHYTSIIEREKDGGYHASCPALPGCHSQGDTYEETVDNITDAIRLYIESLKAHSETVPSEDLVIKPIRIAA
ncbi:MAG: type II toxin-antitoxin system HicB family antitoxin [Candidatus Sumerlaeota bacterium]|nr:type II toxin-antitoxin system HicB family antitoxin [Candidatus Sumerlaeota bacterium]